jgi:hypothetical protein
VLAHNRLDGLGGFVRIIEGNGADIVVQNVGLDDSMKQLPTNEAELAVDGCGGAASKIPGVGVVVGKCWVCVLKESNGN